MKLISDQITKYYNPQPFIGEAGYSNLKLLLPNHKNLQQSEKLSPKFTAVNVITGTHQHSEGLFVLFIFRHTLSTAQVCANIQQNE
jgi:hypothetical protein